MLRLQPYRFGMMVNGRPQDMQNEDFYLVDIVQSGALRRSGIKVNPNGLTLITEAGYLLLVK